MLANGVKPEEITDVIISHVHWDHLDGIDLFPKARVWIQREEFDYYLDSAGAVKKPAIDPGDAKVLAQIAREGRVMLVDGDAKEIIPGITVYTGGKHTFASQFAAVRTASSTVVLASDNMYLYENLARHVPIAQTLDSASNLRAQARMVTLASDPRLIVLVPVSPADYQLLRDDLTGLKELAVDVRIPGRKAETVPGRVVRLPESDVKDLG